MTLRRTLTACTAFAMGLLVVGQGPLAVGAESQDMPPTTKVVAKEGAQPRSASGGRARSEPNADGEGRAERRGGKNGKAGRGGGRGAEPMPLTEDQVEDAIALMVELDPSIAPHIEQLRGEHPEQLRHALSRRFPRVGYMLKLKESRPDLYALRVSDIRLENLSKEQARALAALPEADPAREAARAALRATLEKHFGVRQDVRRVELAALREKLVQMEARLDADEGRGDAMVERRLAELEAKPPPPTERGDLERRRGRRAEGTHDDAPRDDAPREKRQRETAPGGGAAE